VLTTYHSYGDGVNPDAVLGFLILFISYAWKVGSLFDGVCSAYQQWIRYPVQWTFEKLLSFTARRYISTEGRSNAQRLGWLLLHRIVVAVWVPYFAVFETLGSFSTAIWIACLGLVFGTIQIAIPRKQNEPLLGANENIWSFGQLVPLILLIQPFSVVWEHLIYIPKKPTQEESSDRSINTVLETATTPKAFEARISEQVQQSTSLLSYLETHEPMKPASRVQNLPTPIESILLGSNLFHLNVILIQPAIVAASALAFYTDAWLIGYSTTGNWNNFCIVLGVYVGAAWLSTFCLLPWFALGRRAEESRTPYASIGEQMEDGIALQDQIREV
jgi:uncharacterized membrane protein YqaE (UPF0057 family)